MLLPEPLAREKAGDIVEVSLLDTSQAAQLALVLPAHLLVHVLLARPPREHLAGTSDLVSLGCSLHCKRAVSNSIWLTCQLSAMHISSCCPRDNALGSGKGA